MDKKKILLIAGAAALTAVILLVMLTVPRQSQGVPMDTGGTTLEATEGSGPAWVPQTDPLETTVPPQTQGTEPVQTGPEETPGVYTEPEETDPPVYESAQFPVELEDGMVTVRSIFQFTGMNPDADDLYGEDIAGVQMTNTSDEYLRWAEVTAILADGTTLTFRAEDVPPGKTVIAFALEHEALADPGSCEEIYGYAEFTSGDPLCTDLVRVSVDGTEVTVENVSGRDLTNLDVYCHGVLDDSYFGGTTYCYSVASLPAGKSTVIQAVDCILGMAEVVRVDQGG